MSKDKPAIQPALNQPNIFEMIGDVIMRCNSVDMSMAEIICRKVFEIPAQQPTSAWLYASVTTNEKLKLLEAHRVDIGLTKDDIASIQKLMGIRNNLAHGWLRHEEDGTFTFCNAHNYFGRGIDISKQHKRALEIYRDVGHKLMDILNLEELKPKT